MSKSSPEEEAYLSPMWQRIARSEVDLGKYSDEEILTAQIRMADGRLAPVPKILPHSFIQEQVKRGMRVAEKKIRQGSDLALDVYLEVLGNKKAANADRMRAAQFFTDRFLGKDIVKVQVAEVDRIQSLFESILLDPDGLLDPPDE